MNTGITGISGSMLINTVQSTDAAWSRHLSINRSDRRFYILRRFRCGMTQKEIREIQFEKGRTFTTKFIKEFDEEWTQVTQGLKESGADLSLPIAKR